MVLTEQSLEKVGLANLGEAVYGEHGRLYAEILDGVKKKFDQLQEGN